MMNVFDAIEKRRSIRKYKKDDVPESTLEKILNAVRLAPSACNRQPWKLVIVRDAETRKRIGEACHYYSSRSGNFKVEKWVADAPVVIVACGLIREANIRYYNCEGEEPVIHWDWDTYEEESAKHPGEYESAIHHDIAIVLDHLSLAALAEGLGTCFLGSYDEREIRSILSIPDEVRVPLMMTLGYPDKWPNPRPKKSLSELIYYDEYA